MREVTILYHNREIIIPDSTGELFSQIMGMIGISNVASVTADNNEGMKILLTREAMLNSIIFEKNN